MLTLDPSLLAELARAAPDVRRIVIFELVEDVLVGLVDGEGALFGYTPSIVRAVGSGITLDAFVREVVAATSEIVFRADGVARAFVRNTRVVGKLVQVKLGTPNVDEADWLPEWRGIIDNWKVRDSGEITFPCKDGFAYLQDLKITLGVIGQHPLDVVRTIFSTYLPADLWNPTGFNFETDTTQYPGNDFFS